MMESNQKDNMFMLEKEFIEPRNLCDASGALLNSSIGWSRQPIFNCNLRGRTFRKKKWNYWYMVNDSLLFSITVSNLDYIGMIFTYAYDFKTGKFMEKTVAVPFGRNCNLPNNVHESIHFENKDMQVLFDEVKGNTHIQVSTKDFGGQPLSADLIVYHPKNHETMNVVIPWSNHVFQFTSKHNCLPVKGSVEFMGSTYTYDAQTDYANLDFGRGIWPYQSMWNWATASGLQEGHSVGLNLGGTWTDGTGLTENALLIDGHITKLSEKVDFHYDVSNLMSPWIIKTHISSSVDLKFTPIYNRSAETNAFVLKSSVHQMMGTFNGTIISDSGHQIHIENLRGCSEEHYAKW